MEWMRLGEKISKDATVTGFVELDGEMAGSLIAIAIMEYLESGDEAGLEMVRLLRDEDGNPAPIDEMVAEVRAFLYAEKEG